MQWTLSTKLKVIAPSSGSFILKSLTFFFVAIESDTSTVSYFLQIDARKRFSFSSFHWVKASTSLGGLSEVNAAQSLCSERME